MAKKPRIVKDRSFFKRIFYSKAASLVTGGLFVVLTIILWQVSRVDDLENLQNSVDSTSEVYVNKIDSKIDTIEFNMDELAGHGPPDSLVEERDWDTRTNFYVTNLTGIEHIMWIDDSLTIRRVTPSYNETYVEGECYCTDLRNPNHTYLISPVFDEEVMSGFFVADIDVAKMIFSIDFELESTYMVRLFNEGKLLDSSSNWEESNTDIEGRKTITFKNSTYTLILIPTNETLQKNIGGSNLLMVFGLFLSSIITYIWYTRSVANVRLEKLVKKKTQELSYMSYHDQLTGLFNRRHYENQIALLEESGSSLFSIIMADINGLKLVNDAFGHMAGDTLLKSAAVLMQKYVPKDGVVCRLGGDEFVVLLPNKTRDDAEMIISKIEEASKKIRKENITLSISFGSATREKIDLRLVELFRIAEDRMYQSKLIEVPSMRSNAIDTIMKTLNEKDNYSEQHVRNVALLSERLASSLKLPISDVREVRTAGLLHDIGKIIIPSNILNKTGKLTDEEYSIMKTHPEIGFRILNSTSEMRAISKIVLHHHERWDGHGYPQKLQKEDIPFKSRLISVADAFDAMTTERTYKKTMTKEEALKELQRCSESQFDPTIVQVFVEHFDAITKDIPITV